MTWDGQERRDPKTMDEIRSNLSLIHTELALITQQMKMNHKSFRSWADEVDRKNKKYDELLHGNGKEGLVSVINGMRGAFEKHEKMDQFFHRTFLLTGIGIIGFLVKVVFF